MKGGLPLLTDRSREDESFKRANTEALLKSRSPNSKCVACFPVSGCQRHPGRGKHGQRYLAGNYLETMIINSKAASHEDYKTKF